MEMIKITNLIKTYGNKTVVDDISFEVQNGEVFGFLGPNGAGKTSTINMMIGLSQPTAGSIMINGLDIRKQTKKAQAIMGIVSDESNLYNEMDGFDNLCFCAALYGMRRDEREAKARELLDQFSLKDAGNRTFKTYSRGMRRKLTIAAALMHSPQIIFLDEPTTGIDVESTRHIWDMIVKLKHEGTTIFLTTHYIEEAERICDRIAFIANGRIVASGTPSQLMENATFGHKLRLVLDKNAVCYAEELKIYFPSNNVMVCPDHTLTIESEQRIPLSPIVEFFRERDIDVYEASELRPSLEDVFVKLTGIQASTLREDEKKSRL